MLTIEELDALAERVPGDPDLSALLDTLRRRAAPVLAGLPHVPKVKALLSVDGGVCPDDRSPLEFDPWSPDQHRCPRCGNSWNGDRHHRHWARAQHLWIAERAAELALLAALTREDAPSLRAVELLKVYESRYFELPNRDNVLGPSHLFFSTYLESLWLTSYLAAAFLLRETGALDEERIEAVNQVADEAARIIGEFDEGLSNRQTWHAAALTAISAWFGDPELGQSAVESRTGVIGHLMEGFGGDGMWWEGENYHLFALRGILQGIHWAHAAGFDLTGDPRVQKALTAALLAPSRSALPDLTYPARRDSRYGVSLAQPASLDLWEIGRGWLGGANGLDSWLGALYQAPVSTTPPLVYDAWLHDAGLPKPVRPTRAGLSWWALTAMAASDSAAMPPYQPASALLPDQGLAVLRHETTYASLECGRDIGGHGHPDRLHLTLHANGVHWLPDPGTGSYVEPELAWYRSALAHNAPIVDGENAAGENAECSAFAGEEGYAWCAARAGTITRAIVLGPDHLVDVVAAGAAEARFDLPWHVQGAITVTTPGAWSPAPLDHPFVTGAERFTPATAGDAYQIAAVSPEGRQLTAFVLAPGAELWRATAPGLPGTHETRPFLLLRTRNTDLRWVTVLDTGGAGAVQSVSEENSALQVRTTTGSHRYEFRENAVVIEHGGKKVELGGAIPSRLAKRPVFREATDLPGSEASAAHIRRVPALDGTLDGFDTREPLSLAEEHQYRRSEEAYDPETFSATGYVNWDGEALYVAVEVNKPDVIFRAPEAAPLFLDNEQDDVNSDGIQLYVMIGESLAGTLVIPAAGGGLTSRDLGDPATHLAVSGGWARTATGYCVTCRVADNRIPGLPAGERIGFDLLVNEMQEGRTRRAGQLVWGGGGGWIYLRGDRHERSQLGQLELA